MTRLIAPAETAGELAPDVTGDGALTRPAVLPIDLLMIIDDNKVDQMMYKRVVKRSGLVGDILTFHMAQDALHYLDEGENPRPDVILLDINMPCMDGFEFLETATQTFGEEFAKVVVMLTTSLDPRDIARARSFSSVKEYLDKPLTLERLEKVSTLL